MNVSKKILPIGLVSLLVIVLSVVLIFNFGTARGRINRMLNRGMKYISDGRFEDARLEFDNILKIDGRNIDALRGLIESYLGLGDEASIDDCLDKGIMVIENSDEDNLSDALDSAAYIYYMKGQQVYSSNNAAEADKYYQIAYGYNTKYKDKNGKDSFVKPLLDKVYDGQANADNSVDGNNTNKDATGNSDKDNSDSAGGINRRESAVDVSGFKVIGASIFDVSNMNRSALVSYCRATVDIPYGQSFEYGDGSVADWYQNQPIPEGGGVPSPGWLMAVHNDSEEPVASFSYYYYDGTASGSTQVLSILVDEGTGMRLLVACPNIPEMKPYITVPADFPPLDGGLEAVKDYLTANGLEYKEYSENGDSVTYYLPDSMVPAGYRNGTVYFGMRDGEICVQIGLQ